MALASAPNPDPDSFELGIAADKVCFVIVKARQFDVKEGNADPDSGSNPIDDGMTDVLEHKPDDPVYRELVAFIGALDLDEQLNLVALAWLGRGTYDKSEWPEALQTARRAQQPHRAISPRAAAARRLPGRGPLPVRPRLLGRQRDDIVNILS